MSFPIICPFANKINLLNCEKKDWVSGKPLGITVHDSADRDPNRVISWLNHENLGYHIIVDRDGTIIQTGELNKSLYHAGNSLWNELSPNRYHIAVCILSWGKLESSDDKFYSWNKQEIPFDEVEIRADFLGNTAPYDKATKKQEDSFLTVMKYLVSCGIDPLNVCGHDEACIPRGRKSDPGGVLSFSMEGLRTKLHNQKGII